MSSAGTPLLRSGTSTTTLVRDSLNANSARLLNQIEAMRAQLSTLLAEEGDAAERVFRLLDPLHTGRLSPAEFCTALERLGVGMNMGAQDPTVEHELRRALTGVCASVGPRGNPVVLYREKLAAAILMPLSAAALGLDSDAKNGPAYLSGRQPSRLSRASGRRQSEPSPQLRLPGLDFAEIRAELDRLHPGTEYIARLKTSLDVLEAGGTGSAPSRLPELANSRRLPEIPQSQLPMRLPGEPLAPSRPLEGTPFAEAMSSFKYWDESRRSWPYNPVPRGPEPPPYRRKVKPQPKPIEIPERIPPPVALKCLARSIAFSWEEHTMRHDQDFVHVYELEVSERCPLDGQKPFELANGGDDDTAEFELAHVVRKLLPLTEVRARVSRV